jgi:four helix bundle protein
MSESIIGNKSFDFALQVIELYKKLVNEKEFVISKQLLRSATSIGANVQESISAQSKKDFINKMYIALKESRESKYWLMLLKDSTLTNIDINIYLDKVEEIIKILTSIVKTTKINLTKGS